MIIWIKLYRKISLIKSFNLKKTLARNHNFYSSYGPKYGKNGVFMVEDRRSFFHETNFFKLFLGRGIQKNSKWIFMKTENEELKFHMSLTLRDFT